MSSRRSSRGAKPITIFTDTDFIGSYANKAKAVKAKAKEHQKSAEVAMKTSSKVKAKVIGEPKKKKNVSSKRDSAVVVADIPAPVQIEEPIEEKAPKKRKYSHRKPPKYA
jgi:hypothetical protein